MIWEIKDTMTNKTKRELLFSVYSKNLSFYMPEFTDHFLCPVCKSLFGRIDIKKLSLAHIIPKSMGGKRATLACSQCDNRIGHDFDWHLSKEKELLTRIKENKGIYSKLKLNGDSKLYPIIFDIHLSNSGHLDMHIKPPSNVPSIIWKEHMDELINNKNTIDIETTKLFSPERRNISYIYSAFLLMFSKFGYEYVLSPNMDSIRQVLMGNYEFLKNQQLVRDLPKSLVQVSVPSICMLIKPVETRAFCIFLPSTKNNQIRCVFLPGFGKTGEEGYNNLLNLVGTQPTLEAQINGFSLINSCHDIDDTNSKNYGNFIWDSLIKKS
jgi:hypothetical protein